MQFGFSARLSIISIIFSDAHSFWYFDDMYDCLYDLYICLVIQFWSLQFDLSILCAMFHYFRPHIALSTYSKQLYYKWILNKHGRVSLMYSMILRFLEMTVPIGDELFTMLHNLFKVCWDWKLNLDKLPLVTPRIYYIYI